MDTVWVRELEDLAQAVDQTPRLLLPPLPLLAEQFLEVLVTSVPLGGDDHGSSLTAVSCRPSHLDQMEDTC